MNSIVAVLRFARAMREFLMPSYRPEQHYMRGPGPACARRASSGYTAQPT